MNKQAFTFLTLFSLILVLSIYYIMLPPTSENEVVQNDISTIEQLQNQLDQKREDIITKNNEIIATKNVTEKEKSIVSKLKEMGYAESYVEIDQQTIKITILKKDATQTDASKVIKEVLNLVGDSYQVEVKFIEE